MQFQCRKYCRELDNGQVSEGLKKWLKRDNIKIESSKPEDIVKQEVKDEVVEEEIKVSDMSEMESTPTKCLQQVPDMGLPEASPHSSQSSTSSQQGGGWQ